MEEGSSAWAGSGDVDDEPALLSRSSSRLFIFLPLRLLMSNLWFTRDEGCQLMATYGSYVERSGSVSGVAPQGLRSLSNPRLGSHWR